jgi:hypothetical protein
MASTGHAVWNKDIDDLLESAASVTIYTHMTEVAHFSAMLIYIHQATWHHTPLKTIIFTTIFY